MKSPLVTRSRFVGPLLIVLAVAGALAVGACGSASTAANSSASPRSTVLPEDSSASLPSALVAEATTNLKPLSRVGGLIAFVQFIGKKDFYLGGDSYLCVVRPDGTGLKTLTRLRPQAGVFPGKPAWSPDGRSIAFLSGDAVWVMNADGSQRRQVSTTGLGVTDLAWSADGTRMVLTTGREGHNGLVLMNADGSGLESVIGESSRLATYGHAVWAPDGRIYFARHDKTSDLGEISWVNADGSGLTVVSAGEDSFSLSPDGRWLLLFDSGRGYAVRMAADGRGREQVVLGKDQWEKYLRGAARWPIGSSWSPEGRWIAVATCGVPTMGLASSGLWIVKSDGCWDPRLLPTAGWKVFDPAWQPQ